MSNRRGGYQRRREEPPPLSRVRASFFHSLPFSLTCVQTQRLHKMIYEAGDETSPQRLSFVARSLEDECRDRQDDVVARTLLQCASLLGARSSAFAVLAGLLNLRLPAFGALVSEQATLALARELQAGRVEAAAGLLRHLADLCHVRVVLWSTLAAMYTQLAAAPSAATVGLILRTLPWAGRGLAVNEGSALDVVMEAVTGFVNDPERQLPVPAMCVMDDDDVAHENYLSWALDQIELLRANDWDSSKVIVSMTAPHALALDRGEPHAVALPDLSLPEDATENPLQPHLIFRLFPRDESEKDLAGNGAERLALEIFMVEAMRYFAGNLDLVVQRIMSLPMRGSTDFILVETVLGQLLMLPRPELPRTFYHSLIDCLYKAHPRLPPLFERAIDVLFQNVDHLDVECRERLIEWMAVFLANTSFKWDWKQWKEVLSLPNDHPKVLFVRAVLGRCVRLSYWARIEGTIPSDWVQPLMPPPPTPAMECDADLLAVIKAGQKPQGEVTLDTLLPAVLARGETFSLLKLALRQYGGILRKSTASDEAKLSALKLVGSFWADSEGHRLMVVDLLMSVLVVDHLSIVSWVFSEESASLMNESPWEILEMAFMKTVERTAFLRERGDTEKLEAQLREEKDLFLTTFQRFVIVMESYLGGLEDGAEPNAWFKNVLSHMVAFTRRHEPSIIPFKATLQSVVFSDTNERISKAFLDNFGSR